MTCAISIRAGRLARALVLSSACGVALCAVAAEPPVPGKNPVPAKSFVQRIEGVDISGTWIVEGYVPSARPTKEKMLRPLDGGDVPLQPWAQKLYDERLAKDKTADAFMNTAAYCLPLGMPSMMLGATYPFTILQTPGQVTTVHEEGHVYRQIFLNRPHAADPDPGYLGDSVGHWEGDTLVIDTIGLNDKTVLDLLAIPHSDQLHVVERIRRVGPKQLENILTFADPKAFTRAWRYRRTYALAPAGVHPAEYFCQDGQMNTPDPTTGRPTYPGG